MDYNLLSKDDCDAICAKTEAFYRADRVVEGVNVAIYDYRLASISDFVDNKAFELRGLCFVEQPDGTWARNLLMNKFFNINQTVGWMYDEVKHKKIIDVANKEDGSIISFVKFPNGKVRAKSKTSFESDQARMAQAVYEADEKFRTFLDRTFESQYTAIFELVSPENQIVLEYQNTELILLQIRDNTDGEYLDLFRGLASKLHNKGEEYFVGAAIKDSWGIKIAERIASKFGTLPTLDHLLADKETNQEPIEGYIGTFEDGQKFKVKTNKYLSLHGLIGPDAFRENLLIKTIVDGNIDDVIAQLVPGEKKDRIIKMNENVDKYFNHQVVEFIRLWDEFHNKYKKDRKKFAMEYAQKHPMFGSVMKAMNVEADEVEKFAETAVKEYIEKTTNSLGKAKDWLEKI